MSSPRISVALAVYNGAAHLEAQLDSLLAQDVPDFEIVASDDASIDGSLALLQACAARDNRLRVLSQPRTLGFTNNFAAAFAACRGELICPSDQDDLWRSDKLRLLAAALGEADLVYCDSELIGEDGRPLGARLSEQRGMCSGKDPLVFVLSNCVSGHAMLFRRALLARALPIPEDQYYDWWIAIVAACSAGVRYLDEPLVQFRRHGTTATGLGGVRRDPVFALEPYLRERQQLLAAMRTLSPPSGTELEQLHTALTLWIDQRQWLPLLRFSLRHHRRLLHPLRPRLGRGVLRVLKSALRG